MLYVFDEVQASNRALTALKYVQESGFPHHVIAAGSLLGVAVNKGDYSLPVGKVNTMTIHPMTFDEFMVATGHGLMLEGIREAYAEMHAYQLHDQAMDLYRTYLLVGGMPEAVDAYARSGDVRDAVRVHRDTLNLYLADMAKYAPNPTDVARARDVWNSVPGQLAKENHKFQYKQVRSGGRASQYDGAISWLLSAGLVDKCVRVSSGQVPVEVKSTENARSRSLGVYRKKYRPDRVVRVSARDFGTGDVESIPLYAVGCLADGLALAQGSSSPLPWSGARYAPDRLKSGPGRPK
uniref:AAA family ATPase n=1 Tax=Olsenella uli TaxID=133926 RepID=UPI0028E473E1|nr:AAA family ATPase [Olsenella uli]